MTRMGGTVSDRAQAGETSFASTDVMFPKLLVRSMTGHREIMQLGREEMARFSPESSYPFTVPTAAARCPPAELPYEMIFCGSTPSVSALARTHRTAALLSGIAFCSMGAPRRYSAMKTANP